MYIYESIYYVPFFSALVNEAEVREGERTKKILSMMDVTRLTDE